MLRFFGGVFLNSKLKKFMSDNYGFIAIGLVGIFLFVYFQFMHLGSSDDRVYSIVANSSLKDFLRFMQYHYDFCNGRVLVHVFLMLTLRFGVYLWRILCPFTYISILIMIAKFLSKNRNSFNRALMIISLLVFCINTQVYSDSLFWQTGSLNYIFPFFLLMVTLLFIKYKKFLEIVPFLSFFCGATTEQCGMISIACFAFWFVVEFKCNKRCRIVQILSVLASICGLLTIVFSPSVSARIYTTSESFIDKLLRISFNYWFKSEEMFYFMLVFSIAVSFCLYRSYTNKSKRWAFAMYGIVMICSMHIQFLNVPKFSALAQWAYPCMLLVEMLYICVLKLKQKNFFPLFAILLGAGAQFMMAASPRFPVRATMPSLFCFIAFIVSILCDSNKEKRKLKAKGYIGMVLATLLLVFICCNNFSDYISFAEAQAELFENGEYVNSYANKKYTSEDIDSIIRECEQVRLDNIKNSKMQ